jgi:hypothetical protein
LASQDFAEVKTNCRVKQLAKRKPPLNLAYDPASHCPVKKLSP